MPPSRPVKDRETMKARVLANRYEIVHKLGSGNFGVAYLCKDMKCNNQLKVLKEIPVGDLQPDETLGVDQEAKLLSKLDHPGIVKFYDSFVDEDFFCIVTEYCEGGDLNHKIEEYKKAEKSFDEGTVLDWTIQLLLAAHYIHSRRVLHRDLKTRNIFIQNNLMKIGDFGISRILMGTTDMASTFTGTPYYMSPEVLKHEGYNSQSDVWSIGCIMYELCTLEHAFIGQGLMAIMYKIVEKDPPDLPSKYSKELSEVFKKMLNKDPLKRPSAAEVLKLPFMARHLAKMKETLTDEHKVKDNISPEDADREANDIASLLREKSHLGDHHSTLEKSYQQNMQQSKVQEQKLADKKLTPREKMRLKKMEEADKQAKNLKRLTKLQLVENAVKRQQNKTSHEKTTLSAWKGDNNESTLVKQPLTVKNNERTHYIGGAASDIHHDSDSSDDDKETEHQTVIRRKSEHGVGQGYRIPTTDRLTRTFSHKTARTVSEKTSNRLSVTFGGTEFDDRPIAPMKDKMVYSREHSSLDFKDGIPDTADQANTFYGQFSDFDDDASDNEETTNDREEFINHLEKIHSKDTNEESTIVNDDAIHGAYGPYVREKKIKNIRTECVRILGQEEFEKAYNYLRTARSDKNKSEKEIMQGLRKYMKNPSDCFMVDQLLFLEEQAKLN